MKGVIADCLQKLVNDKFGESKWREIMKLSGMPETSFLVSADIDDAKVMTMISNVGKILNISQQQLIDVFGDYWVNNYSSKIYGIYYSKYKTAKELIKGLDNIHEITTRTVPNAAPPRFEFQDVDANTLMVTYKSRRNMIDFYVGLVKGVGKYYKTPLTVQKLSNSQVKITFK